jgi:hypothetical protein
MSTKSREVIFGCRFAAPESTRTARANAPGRPSARPTAEAEAWSIRMEGFGGPAQPSPTIGRCLNGGLRWLESPVQPLQDPRELAARCHPPAARYADLEAGSGAEMPVMPQGPLRAAGAYDQADGDAGDHALPLGASGGLLAHARIWHCSTRRGTGGMSLWGDRPDATEQSNLGCGLALRSIDRVVGYP